MEKIMYRGYEIDKFYSDKFVPRHIVREYYQGERDRIDRMIKLEEIKKNTDYSNIKTVDECLDEWFKEMEE